MSGLPAAPQVPVGAAVDVDAWVRDVVRWHFHSETGSPFWQRLAETLPFQPLTDIHGAADLHRFPDITPLLRQVPAADLIPRACRGRAFQIWESGGTIGPAKRIVDAGDRAAGIAWVSQVLDQHGFPTGAAGDWLFAGPSGPHLVGQSVPALAGRRGALCHRIDMDPRWVKRCLRQGDPEIAAAYLDHLADQALQILHTQPVAVLASTPPLIERLCSDATTLELLQRQLSGLIWFGTAWSEESLRLLEEDLLPQATVVGWYGNTMMGIACQRPRRPGDTVRAVFQPPHPRALVRVVDAQDPTRPVAMGEEGQVAVSLLGAEFFIPWNLERDLAVAIPSAAADFPWPGLARVRPLPALAGAPEGVY